MRQRQRTEERPPTYWHSFSRCSMITLEDFLSINQHKTVITVGRINRVRQDNIHPLGCYLDCRHLYRRRFDHYLVGRLDLRHPFRGYRVVD